MSTPSAKAIALAVSLSGHNICRKNPCDLCRADAEHIDRELRNVYYKRWDEIPDPIRQLSNENIAVHRICEEYAQGRICTLPEALCQMVLVLNTDWIKQRDAYWELHRMTTIPKHLS